MTYAKIHEGAVVRYPYTRAELQADYPRTSFPLDLAPEVLADFGAVAVAPTPAPTVNPLTQRAVEAAPALVGGVWTQQWEVAPYTPPVPDFVSPRQIRQALTRAGLRQAVETAVSSGDQDVKDWWEFATSFERTHPMVIGMGQALGKTDADLDDLWRLAGSL